MRRLALAAMAACLYLVPLGAQGDRPLQRAVERVEKNDADGVRRLLAQDPSLVKQTGAGLLPYWRWTLLHLATAHKASLDVVRALVDAGADVNARDDNGNTPLHFAVRRINHEMFPEEDYHSIIRLLLDHKADVHLVNLTGASALHAAAAFRADRPAVEMLIHAGANVDLQTLKSAGALTPLHVATEANDPGIVTVLLQYGARMNVIDVRELTPTLIAERRRFDTTANVLHAYGTARAVNMGWTTVLYVPPAVSVPASLAGVVQGRLLWNGQPVAGAAVSLADADAGFTRYGSTTTDDQGRFSFAGVSPGHKQVEVDGNQRVAWISGGAPFVTTERSTMTIRQFNQDVHVCHVFDLGSPAQNESVGSRPVLRWDAHPDAHRYVVDVFDRASWIAREWVLGAGATSVQVESDLPPGRYQWRVVATGTGGDVIACSSEPREFVVQR